MSAALTAQAPQTITTNFAGANANNGVMFDIVGGPAGVTIDTFETNLNPGTHDISIYACTAGSFVPNGAIPSNWTLIGSQTGLVSNGAGVPTLISIPVCYFVAPSATQGFYVTITNGGTIRYTIGTAVGAPIASNADLTIQCGVGVTYPFTPGTAPREFNTNTNYFVGFTTSCSTPASKSPYGTGCYSNPRMVHELFLGGSTIDLINTNWTLTYVPAAPGAPGPTYVVNPGANPYNGVVPPLLGTDLLLTPPTATSSVTPAWDDGSTNKVLPFAFPFANPGSPTTTDITINSNAKIYLGFTTDPSYGSTGANSGYAVTSFNGTTGAPFATIAAFMNDLDPTVAGGHIWYEDPSPNGGVRITWEAPNWQNGAYVPAAGWCYTQMELLPNGNINLAYGSSMAANGSAGNDANVGYSGGGGQPETPSVDWSTLNNYVTGNGLLPLAINGDIRPLLGQTVALTVSEVPAGSFAAGIIYGLTNFGPAGIPLLPVGLPNCQLYASLDIISLGLFPGTTYTENFPIPGSLAYAGFQLAVQGLALSATIPNSFGGITSNGLALTLGNL